MQQSPAVSPVLNDAPEETGTKFTPNPKVTELIRSMVAALMSKHPTSQLTTVLYYTVRSTLRNEALSPGHRNIIPVIFSYYLETYKAYKQHEVTTPQEDLFLYNEAVLTVFDLYADEPEDLTLRQMVVLAAEAVHHVMTHVVSSRTENKESPLAMNDAMQVLSNLALITRTVKQYVKSAKRSPNLAYIEFLHDLFEELFSDFDIMVMHPNPVEGMSEKKNNIRLGVKSVLVQISNNSSVIKVH